MFWVTDVEKELVYFTPMTKLKTKKHIKKPRASKREAKRKGTLVEFLMASPLHGSGIEIKRLPGPLRKIDFS